MSKTKEKDPAFLFYSLDFYEGTRMMLPEERACFIDLLIFQHQNGGSIPNDLRRLRLYCSGIDEATLQATLEAKFKLCDNGSYVNTKLQKVMEERSEFTGNQAVNGKVGQFFKKAKAILSAREFLKLQSFLNQKDKIVILELIKDKSISKAMLQAMLKHLEDEDVVENEIEDEVEIEDEITLERGAGKTFTTFEKSVWFDKERFLKDCPEDWPQAKKEHYYLAALNWSADKPKEKKSNWIRTVKVWDGNNPWKGQTNGTPRPQTESQRIRDLVNNNTNLVPEADRYVEVPDPAGGVTMTGRLFLDEDGLIKFVKAGRIRLTVDPQSGFKPSAVYKLAPGMTIDKIYESLLIEKRKSA